MGFHLQLLLCVAMATVQGQRILFLGSNVIRPGANYDVTVSSLTAETLSVTVSVENNITSQVIGTAFRTIPSGTQVDFLIPIPSNIDDSQTYIVRVLDGTESNVRYQNTSVVGVQRKSRSFFITTDKAIYKPGATVKFRAFAVTSNLKPRTEPMTVEIFDPKDNKIKQWLNVNGEMGVVSGDLELSTLTTLGDWKIKVQSQGEEETQTFKVDEYVLPKFEVEISLDPSFIVVSDESTMSMSVRVSALYNIGTPVNGDLTLTVRGERSWYNIQSTSVKRSISGVQNIQVTFPAGTFKPCGICSMIAEVSVTDSLSGEIREASTRFQTWRNAAKLVFQDGPKFIKPGLKSKFVLKVTQQDGTPIQESNQQVQVKASESSRVNFNTKPVERTYTYPLPSTGMIIIEHDILPNTTTLSMEATYNGATTTTYVDQVFKSFSNNSIEIEQDLSQINSPSMRFTVRSTEILTLVYYQILSKKTVSGFGQLAVNPPSLTTVISFEASAAMAPGATLLVYYLSSTNEIIAASERFDVPFTFNNQVEMSWDQERTKVQDPAVLTVRAEAGSYVSVAAVDQSVLLLAESNDITADSVREELESYDENQQSSPFPQPRPFPVFRRRKRSIWFPFFTASDTSKVLESAGLIVMSDAFIFREPQYNDRYYKGMLEDGMVPEAALPDADDANSGASNSENSEVLVRSFFPESWLWDSITAGPDGVARFDTIVPDTLTKWVATSFALHPIAGLGIPPQRANLTAFMPFFMRVEKPYSIIRGEEFEMKVIVFNYLPGTKTATVKLLSSQDFFVKENMNDVTAESRTLTKSVQVPSNKGATVTFNIVPQKLGQIILNLEANTQGAADALNEPLLVEPEGRMIEANSPYFVQLEGGQPFSTVETVNFPQTDVVDGSRMIVINVMGDLLGTTLSGLKRLVRMPYGCGEQNMVTFSPLIYVRKYLDRIGSVSAKLRADTTKFMTEGYQRELTYQRDDHSFSAFGKSDPSGSTWLTAFVVSSFRQASEFVFVDEAVLVKSLIWLIGEPYNKQQGTFQEVGSVIHKEMQGGSLNTMTAYVFITLEMCRGLNESVPGLLDAIAGTRQTLEDSVEQTSDPYELAIMAYALQLTGSTSVSRILQKLESQAVNENGMTYWKVASSREGKERKNNEVEMASFVLLTYVLRNDLTKGLPLARFLISRKNPLGGFFSTQDTVWGLNALAEFSAASRTADQQFSVRLTVDPLPTKVFEVNSQNAMVLQKYEISDEDFTGDSVRVAIEVTGRGAGLVEVSNHYYTTRSEPSNKLRLNVETKPRNENVREISSCVTLLDENLNDMIVVELTDASDFVIDKTSIVMENMIKRVEKEGKQTNIYYGEIPVNSEQCVKAVAYKQNEVENAKPTKARAFAYYSGEETSSTVKPTGGSRSTAFASILLTFMAAFISTLI